MKPSFALENIDRLEADLSEPTPQVIEAMGRLEGDILVLGAAGKMGPSLCRLAVRASRDAAVDRAVLAVSRFSDPRTRTSLEKNGIRTIQADLLAPGSLESLPNCSNVILMAGQKFGSGTRPEATWAINALLPGLVARRFAETRMVVFSTGNVYPLSKVERGGSSEEDSLGPIGEYAQSAVARERVLGYLSAIQGTPMSLLRINYAIEPRYGVLRDIADAVHNTQPIDLTMGYCNVIWQRDANAIALLSLAHCAVPPMVLNVTGSETVSVRAVAQSFGAMFGTTPRFTGSESTDALLSNAGRCRELFGPVPVALDEMIERVGKWVLADGPSLNKPTGFEEREGRF